MRAPRAGAPGASRLPRRARLSRSWTLLQIILSLRLAGLIAARGSVRIGLPQRALLGHDLPSDHLRRVHLAHHALVARRLLRRDHERGGGDAAAGAGPDRETAGALRERAEPDTAAVMDIDMPDPAVGVGIKLDIVGARRRATLRHFDQPRGAANAERSGRCRYFHIAGLGDGSGDKGHGALGDIEQRVVLLAAVLINVIVDGDTRVRSEIEGGGVVEGDAEAGIRRRLQGVVEENVVLEF